MNLADQVALHLRLDGVVVDQQTLGQGYDALCPASPLACKWRAWDTWGRVRIDDLARISESACVQGDAGACEVLGLALLALDPEKAALRLRPACDLGSPRACTELGLLVAAGFGPHDADVAAGQALHERACAQGHDAACVRGGRPALAGTDPRELASSCASGVLAACDAWLPSATASGRVEALERLCVADRARCAELAAARAAHEPGVLRTDRPVARATWAPGGVLLGWDAPTFLGHRWVALDDLDHVALVVGEARMEHFVLYPLDGEPVVLPDEGCDAVVAGIQALEAGRRLAWAVDAAGAPTASVCVGLVPGREPAYRSGRLAVVPHKSDDVGAATAVREKLAAGSDALFRCSEAVAGGRVGLFAAELVHARTGPGTKLALERPSGDAAFDACVLGWIGGTDLGESPYKVAHTVEVEIFW